MAKLSKEQKDLVNLVKEFRGISDGEAMQMCQKYRYQKETVKVALENFYEDDKPQHNDEDWKDTRSRRRRKKKEDKSQKQGRKGYKSGRGRGMGRVSRGRGRGPRRGRGGKGRNGGQSRANKENTPKIQTQATSTTRKPAPKVEKTEGWGVSTARTPAPAQPNRVIATANPAFNPHWGRKPKPTIQEDAWQESKTEAAKTFEPPKSSYQNEAAKDKTSSGGGWIQETNSTTQGTSDQYESFNPPAEPSPWDEGKAQVEKPWGSWGGGDTSREMAQSMAEAQNSATQPIQNEWDASAQSSSTRVPQRQPATRQRKKTHDSMTGINKVSRPYGTATSKWRRKERPEAKVTIERLQPQELPTENPESSTVTKTAAEKIMETTQEMANLSVAAPKAPEPDVILPSYVNNVKKNDSMVHFGLAEDISQQNAHDQFLRNQTNGDLFGVEDRSIQAQLPNFSSQPPLRDSIVNSSATTTSLTAPSSSSLQKQPRDEQPKQPQPPSNVTSSEQQNQMESMAVSEMKRAPENAEVSQRQTENKSSSIETGVSAVGPQAAPQKSGKPLARAIGEQPLIYPPHGYTAPTMPHQYGIPSGDSRSTFSMYDQNNPTQQLPHPAAGPYYHDYSLQGQPRYRNVVDPRIHNQRNRMYKGQAKGAKGISDVKDKKVAATAQQNDGPKGGRGGKQQRNFNQKYQMQRYKQHGQAKQNFAKGGFNQKQRQNMPQPFNQQTYAMGAPVQYQPSAMPYYHPSYYNFYHQNQYSPPGFRSAPYYQPPSGYNFHAAAAPGNFHNPQAPTNYEDPMQVRQGPQPTQGAQLHQTQQQQQQQQAPTESMSHSGFAQQVQNGTKHQQAPPVNQAREEQATQSFEAPVSWTAAQMSIQSAPSGPSKITRGPDGKLLSTPVATQSQGYPRQNFYVTPQSFPAEHQQQVSHQPQQQQQQIHHTYAWNPSG